MVFPSLWEGTPLTAFEALAMGKPIVATDADGLLDMLTDGHDALIVPQARCRRRWPTAIVCADRRSGRARTAWPPTARETGARYDIAAFVRKMERLYELLHETSRATRRQGVLRADLVVSDRAGRPADRRARPPRAGRRRRAAPGRDRRRPRSACVLLALAVIVDFPKPRTGFKGDDATYYSLGHSLARDCDFAFSARI